MRINLDCSTNQIQKIMSELYLSELLIHNIKLCRENDTFECHKAEIADALCGITIAMDEVTTPRV